MFHRRGDCPTESVLLHWALKYPVCLCQSTISLFYQFEFSVQQMQLDEWDPQCVCVRQGASFQTQCTDNVLKENLTIPLTKGATFALSWQQHCTFPSSQPHVVLIQHISQSSWSANWCELNERVGFEDNSAPRLKESSSDQHTNCFVCSITEKKTTQNCIWQFYNMCLNISEVYETQIYNIYI